MNRTNNTLLMVVMALIVLLFGAGIAADGITGALKGFFKIQVQPGRLISDFIPSGGVGGTFINAAVSGALGLAVVMGLKVKLSGPTYAAILTIIGFGFFGKTPLNMIPILTGVYLSSRIAGKMFSEYIIIALFGTALGPLVSFIAFGSGLGWISGLAAAVLGGIGAGFLLPAIAVSMLHLHQGYNLYNMGLSCGFFSLFAASLIKASGRTLEGSTVWFSGFSPWTFWMIPVLSVFLIISGLIMAKRRGFMDFAKIQGFPGRLPSDFMDLVSTGGALINSGILGLIGFLYVYFAGANLNGPVIGGIMTVMGFGAFGTHLKNSWPVVAGIVLSAVVFNYELSSPGPVLAVLFGTTLSPIAGQFGVIAGITAGFIHLFMVMQTGAWQGGINLYNNGFAGGLTAAFMVAVIHWYRTSRRENVI